MSAPAELPHRSRSSRQQYREFVQDYKHQRLDDEPKDAAGAPDKDAKKAEPVPSRGKRRTYLREYFRWLWPHRFAVGQVFLFAVFVAGFEMVEPLFMRFIIDRVLMNSGLDTPSRLLHLNLAGGTFLAVVILSKSFGVLKDYRQRQLNVRVTLALRRALYDRMLHLPLPRLWEMKTGGILSRLTGDVDSTTGLLQMMIVSPSLSMLRLVIAFSVLVTLNWRLALAAAVVVPGAMAISYVSARRVRPIYRAVRKDVERIDGRVGETVSGIRVVRAFGREMREFVDYITARHAVLRKELFAHRRELVLWSSWGLLVAAVNVVIVWYGGYLSLTGRASVGDIMAFQVYTIMLLGPVWNLVNSFSELQRSLAAMERVFEVLAMEPDKPDRPNAVDAPTVVREIRFENVEFEYREGRPVVREFDVAVPGGSVVALGWAERSGEDDGDRPGCPVPRPDPGADSGQRHGHARFPPSHLPRPVGPGATRRVPVRRVGAGEHCLRPTGCDVRRGGGRRPAGECPRVHRQAAGTVRNSGRRTGGQTIGRSATAVGHRPGDSRLAADPHSGRSDQQPRYGK